MSILTVDYSSLDHEEMAKAIGLKTKYIPMLIGSFLDESNPILESLQEVIQAKDYAQIKMQAHSIKGSAGNLRFNEIYEMAKDMELSAADSDSDFEYEKHLSAIKKAVATISIVKRTLKLGR